MGAGVGIGDAGLLKEKSRSATEYKPKKRAQQAAPLPPSPLTLCFNREVVLLV